MIRLTEGEWAILEVLWSGERFPLGEIVSALRPKMNWRRNTVTLTSRGWNPRDW